MRNYFKVINQAYKAQCIKTQPIYPRITCNRYYSSQPDPNGNSKDAVAPRKKITVKTIQKLYKNKTPITMMTAHDYPTGLWVENSDQDMCLVGDSLGMVALGYDSTSPVTMETMIHHTAAVSRAAKSPFLVADLPFGSYERRPLLGLENAVRLIKEGKAEAVKLEGGAEQCEVVHAITESGIPVVGHVGLTPQRQVMLGGFRVQGKSADQALRLVEDALALQEAGCMSIVLECIPAPIAAFITQQLSVPTIGIGSGVGCSGQVLVMMDMLGIYDKFVPKFCKQYGTIGNDATKALDDYAKEVKTATFPDPSEKQMHSYPISELELKKFYALAGERFGNAQGIEDSLNFARA
ncbi:putative 3-methyl-2-oxobutanoate hydroxymethyltransferase [Neoconidiobolus thromboides FSU 785]|nr:putative 3-methyl-2-oxobutanoate hydroxymethyltransferase [Neoconidiobolus thromboides FSU 785]